MKNLFEYMILFIVLVLFCPNNYLSIIYICANLLIMGLVLLIYFRKSREKEPIRKQIKLSYFVSIMGIILINIIMKNEMLNIIIGFIFTFCYLGQFLYSVIRKDYSFKKNILTENFIFDVYSLIYLVCLTFQLHQYI